MKIADYPIDAKIQYSVDYDRETSQVLRVYYEWFGGTYAGMSAEFYAAIDAPTDSQDRFYLGDLHLQLVDYDHDSDLWVVRQIITIIGSNPKGGD